jgi:hypothetical protein
MISVISGATAGAVGLMLAGLFLRFFRGSSARDINVDLYYDELDQLKRDINGYSRDEGWNPATRVIILLLYGIAIAVIMTVVVRVALSLEVGLAVPSIALIWILVTAVPPGVVVLGESKRLAILEIALVFELIARSQDEQGEVWVVRCSKKVVGGDMFGAEEEDILEFRMSRIDVAPISLSVKGHVVVAETGLGRTVRKSGLRQLRLKGWFVNEIRDVEAEIARVWSLRDSTYAEIAGELAWVVEVLGFQLRNVRISKAKLDLKVA